MTRNATPGATPSGAPGPTGGASPPGAPPGFPDVPPDGWRTFLVLWITQSLSVLGTAMTFFAINIWLTQGLYPRPEQKASLAFALSANSLAFALPTVLAAPIAGAWADRHDRRRVMLFANLVAAALGGVLVTLLLAHALGLPALLAIMALYCLTGAFHVASFDTAYAMLVPRDQLPRANGMMQSMWALSGILSPAAAAALIALPALARQGGAPGPLHDWLARLESGVPFAIAIDVVTFLIAAFTLTRLRIPRLERASSAKPPLLADIRVGADYIRHRPPLLWLLATFAFANLVWSPLLVLQPLFLKFDLAADWRARGMTFEAALATLNVVNGIGGIAGAVAVSVWGGLKRRRVLGVLVPVVLLGLGLVGFGLSRRIDVACVAMFLVGALLPALNAHSQAIWQAQTPRELQGRVFSVRRLIAQFTMPIGTGLGGAIGGLLDPARAVVWMGVIGAAFGAAQLFNPALRNVEDKAALDAMAARSGS
jgi:MFS family permease